MKILKMLQALALASALFGAHAHAGIVIAGTRVIFPASEREVTVKLSNEGTTPMLVQAWIDQGDAAESPDRIDAPFMLTPSMFRMEPGKGQTLRLIYANEPLPADKESLFWLNVLEIPPKAAGGEDRNKLQIAFRSRIKVMYRPDGLAGEAADAPAKVTWRIVPERDGKYALEASNPTQYVANFGSVALRSGGKTFDASMGYVLPGESQRFPIEGLDTPPAANAEVNATSINDWGATFRIEKPLSPKP